MDGLCVRHKSGKCVCVCGGGGETKQITVMEPLAVRPSVYDREMARVQFHLCALLSG